MASAWVTNFQSSSSANQQPDTPNASPELPTTTPVSRPPPQEPLPGRDRISSLSSTTGRPRGLSTTSNSSVRRKPLPTTASPLATRFSTTVEHSESPLSVGKLSFARPSSVDSPTLYESSIPSADPSLHTSSPSIEKRQHETVPPSKQQVLFKVPAPGVTSPESRLVKVPVRSDSLPKTTPMSPSKQPTSENYHARLANSSVDSTASSSTDPTYDYYNSSAPKQSGVLSMFSNKPTPPHLSLSSNVQSRNVPNDPTTINNTNRNLPKSPGASKLGSFFGWGGNTSPASSTTTFSDEKTFSPARSPASPPKPFPKAPANVQRNLPGGIDVPKANAKYDSYFGDAYKQLQPVTPATTVHLEEMEEELKTISADLATSIRREMELEDLVERLQSEAAYPQGPSKRTSDYFSDSGTSSVKYGGETDARTDELDRLQRKTEREKTQIRLELNDKVQDERSRRKALEKQIRSLEQKASQVDLASINSLDANGRLRELESTCEDLKRRLAEERQVKENFEDLLTALKNNLQQSHNERDNLRDEIVPQLRARVEGLEAQAAEHEKLTYEHTKMQQEMQALRKENLKLSEGRKAQVESQRMSRFNSITEEGPRSTRAETGLARSNSLAQGSSFQRSPRPPSLIRSSSVKSAESREVLAERVKDVELQRDALHRALKSLLERQELQNRENEKRIRQLEAERDRAFSNSPRRQGYNQEVTNLREEINTLRRRADEAIEQKWQCEKGLSGLKMDLERAEQEIGSLRILLQENDISIPNGARHATADRGRSGSVTSESLERAYRELQKSHAESLQRVKKLEAAGPKDEETLKAMAQLEQSLSQAVYDRDFARQEAEAYRQSTETLQSREKNHLSSETVLADELRATAKRVEELATQVRTQLASNATLRQRLTETIDRGEKEQKANAARIVHMQGRLRNLEDALMAAQQASEERVQKHEDEVRELKESHNTQLLRVKDGLKSPRLFAPKSPLSPLFAGAGARSPRISTTTTGRGISISEESKTEFLKIRVTDLERALEEADREMQEVVSKMNIAQIEVMELQNEREEAVKQTRRLQARIEDEKLKSFEDRFATLRS